jgi:3-oxoacyl-[acyl-carrier-protein] synthase-1
MQPIAIRGCGLVTSVGLSAPASCAAIRAKITNPTQTGFTDDEGKRIQAHQVDLDVPLRGLSKLARMAAMAIDEALDGAGLGTGTRASIPLLLCVADKDRPGRLDGLDDDLFDDLCEACGTTFGKSSSVIAHDRVGAAVALAQARTLLYRDGVEQVLVASADSLITSATLSHYLKCDRLLTPRNSNGFMAGEAATALLVGKPRGRNDLICTGLGFAIERAHVYSGEPLRGEGLAAAHRSALDEAGHDFSDMGFRIADLSGEQYYFKEADLALSRLLRTRQEDPELWHPTESTGACGASIGGICLAVAHAAYSKRYASAPRALLHFSNDDGRRASLIVMSEVL